MKTYLRGIKENVVRPIGTQIKHVRSRRQVGQILDQRDEIKIEIGSGPKRGTDGWTTIDTARSCDLFWDLRAGIPFPDESVSRIYSSHFLEHLTFDQGQQFLDECMRVLRPGGNFSICVPNAKLFIDAYSKRDPLPDHFFVFAEAVPQTTLIDHVNYIAYMKGHHKYLFDQENLVHLLRAKGMRNARARSFDPTLDRLERDQESIYAEAEK